MDAGEEISLKRPSGKVISLLPVTLCADGKHDTFILELEAFLDSDEIDEETELAQSMVTWTIICYAFVTSLLLNS